MNVISALISIPVSVVLIVWLVRCKKERPFSRGNIIRLIVAGLLSAVVGTLLTAVLVSIRAAYVIGFDTLVSWFAHPDVKTITARLQEIAAEGEFSFVRLFLGQLITIGFAEELSRYLFLRLSTRRQTFAKTALDFAICGGIVGTGFTVAEDLLYSSGGLLLSLLRSLMPFHFTYGAIMGWFVGKAFVTGKKKYHLIGILIPVLLHTIFDSGVTAVAEAGIYIIVMIISLLLNLAATIFMIVKIRQWSKNG